ncbi:hypothetical protein D9M71_532040 [compost metagenome]
MLQQQPAAGQQVAGGVLDDLADVVQAVGAGHQGAGGLETHVTLCQVRVLGGDIGRVADDQGEALLAEGGKPVALDEAGIVQPEPGAVALGELHGGGYPVHAHDLPARAFAGQGQRDGAGAGAEVQHLGGTFRQQRQGAFHQQFGVGTRDQGVRCHFQVKTPETLVAEDVGHRLAAATTLQEGGVTLGHVSGDHSLRPGVQEAARLAQGSGQQQFRVEARGGRVRQAGLIEETGDDSHAQSPRAASWSAWYSASSGSITASTPPAMMSSSA